MDYFKNRKNVDLYTSMMELYDNSFVINELTKILKKGSTILELGMGTGLDLIDLSKNYNVLGSDSSEFFIDDFKKKSDIEVLVLDAIDININKNFDCIYSNKVLQHLTKDDFITSLNSQCNHLKDGGIIFATLWVGEYKQTYEYNGDFRSTFYNEEILYKIIPNNLKIDKIIHYTEFENNDSMIMILSKK